MKKKGTPSTTFGVRLRQARLAAGMSQAAVAEIIMVDRTSYSRYEAGRVEPSLQVAYDLAVMFQVTLDDLLRPE